MTYIEYNSRNPLVVLLVGLVLVCVGLFIEHAHATPEEHRVTNQVKEVISLHNEIRAEHGLKRLTADDNLTKLAQQHTDWMCYYHSTTHSDLNIAENVASGKSLDAKGVMDMWMNSPGHAANILGDHLKIGVGRATMRSRCKCVFYTVMFE